MKNDIKNFVMITGKLVSNSLEFKVNKKGQDCIQGNIVIMTADGSEHEVFLYSNRLKSDGTESKLYAGYVTAKNEFKSIYDNEGKTSPERFENADVVKLMGSFTTNDYLSKRTNEMVWVNQLKGTVVSRVEIKDIPTTKQEAVFEIGGIIASMKDVVRNEVPTGEKVIVINNINCSRVQQGQTVTYEPYSLVPVRLRLPQDLADAFISAGYYEGCYTNLRGQIVNKVESSSSDDVAFGEARTFDRKEQYNLIKGGDKPKTYYDVELTDDIITQLINQRKLSIEETKQQLNNNNVEEQVSSAGGFNSVNNTTSATTVTTRRNPFA